MDICTTYFAPGDTDAVIAPTIDNEPNIMTLT